MRIALIQQHATDDREKNLQRGLEAFERAAVGGAELACFAELAFEPFYPQRPAGERPQDLAQEVPGPVTDAFAARAAELGVAVVLNLYERAGELCFDCSPVIDSDGALLGRARMVHITDYPCFHEQGYYAPGDTGAPVFQTSVGKIGVSICYDRHYPEHMRALALAGAELVVVGNVTDERASLNLGRAIVFGLGGIPERLLYRPVQSGRRRGMPGIRRRIVCLRS